MASIVYTDTRMDPRTALATFDRYMVGRGLKPPGCLALAPTSAELAEAVGWLERQDLTPPWPDQVCGTFDDLARRLGHGL